MTDSSQKKANKPAWIVLGFICLLLSLVIVYYWVTHQKAFKPRPPEPTAFYVKSEPITLAANTLTISASGFVDAAHKLNLGAEVAGRLTALSAQFLSGNRLKKGDWLFDIEKIDYELALAEAKNALASAQSAYEQEEALGRQALRDAKSIGVKSSDLALRKPQLAAAKTALTLAKEKVRVAENHLAKTHQQAPFNALILNQQASVGAMVGSNSQLAVLVDRDSYQAKLTLAPDLLAFVETGNAVLLQDGVSGLSYHGKIDRIDNALDTETRTVALYVAVKNPSAEKDTLLLNSYVSAQISGKQIANSAWVKNTALIDNAAVWSIEAGVIKKVPITLVYRDATQSLVQFGAPISRYVLQASQAFVDGMTVIDQAMPQTAKPQKTDQDKTATDKASKQSTGGV